jgi:rare lipoprotein A
VLALLSGCGTTAPPRTATLPAGHGAGTGTSTGAPAVGSDPALPVLPAAGSGRGGYYQDDGPGESPPPNLWQTPDAEPKLEPLSKSASKAYAVFGKTYTPITDERPFRQRGVGSWYGKKFHGQRTSSGERYDMYKMTAAHPILPIPSYARITSLETGKAVVVRINDRGPFHANRVVDMSYTAALKLGLLGKGSHEIEIERILPDEIARMQRTGASVGERVAVSGIGAAPMVSTATASPVVPVVPIQPAQFVLPVTQAVSAPPTRLATSATERGTGPDQIDQLALNLTRSDSLASAPNSSEVARLLPAAVPASIPVPLSAEVGKSGFYLQLGAYSQPGNAETVRAKLSSKWQGSWPSPQVVQAGNVYRLFSGPFETRAQAFDVAQQMQNDGLGKVLVVQR